MRAGCGVIKGSVVELSYQAFTPISQDFVILIFAP